MESVDELRRALEAARAETAALRVAAEGADRAPRGNDTGDAGEADSAYRATYDNGYARTRTDGHAGANARQGASTAIFFWSGKNRPVPKFPKKEDEATMWHLRFRAHLDGMGLRCQLNSRLAAVASVTTFHHGRRQHVITATTDLYSRQASEKTASPLRLRTGATRMKHISVVLFPPFLAARNRVMAPLLMSCSFQPAIAAAPSVISRGPRRSAAVVTTATVPIGVRSSSTAAVVVVIVRNRSCDTTAAATIQHCGRSSSMAPAPSVALAGSKGALAAMDRPMD